MTAQQAGLLPKGFTGSGSNITNTLTVKKSRPGTLPKGLGRSRGRKTDAVLVKNQPRGSMPNGFERPPDNPNHINTDSDPTMLKHDAKNPDSAVAEVEITEFSGLPADIAMRQANRLLPKVACEYDFGHVYHGIHTVINGRLGTWFCVLECWHCRLRIEGSCGSLGTGARRMLRNVFYKQTASGLNLRIICVRYDRVKKWGNSK